MPEFQSAHAVQANRRRPFAFRVHTSICCIPKTGRVSSVIKQVAKHTNAPLPVQPVAENPRHPICHWSWIGMLSGCEALPKQGLPHERMGELCRLVGNYNFKFPGPPA